MVYAVDRFLEFSRRASWLVLGSLILVLQGPQSFAGLSSENVIVVVNGDSAVSRTVANHYIDARNIPTQNVIVLRDIPDGLVIDLETFKSKILRPILAEVDARKISAFVRVIAYSADFPTSVKIHEHAAKLTDANMKKIQTPMASINGLTYFYRFVLADQPSYLGFASNLYARGKFERYFINPFNNEKKAEFDQAKKLQDEGKYAEAVEIWERLREAHMSMPELAIRCAECYSMNDQPEKAVQGILAALKAGWWSANYLRDTPSLDKHLEDPKIAKLLPLLDDAPTSWQGPQGFSSSVGWTLTGSRVPIKDGGIPYLCSCSLAVVHPNGSTLSTAVRVLNRASKSDRTFPKGRFAFGKGGGVRNQTRLPGVADAVVYLQQLGQETELFSTAAPTKTGAVSGLMTGTSSVDLLSQPWVFVRGAISENLTSFGGKFNTANQTKLTAYLSAGAAMSSGTVAEPYSVQFKFPHAMMYPFYARGLTAIEAFYQSVTSPYQLLIVGDPLAQPFARAPDELVEVSLQREGKRRLKLTRRSLRLKVPKSSTGTIEISINHRLFQVTPAVPNIEINWPANTSGIYDIRATLNGVDRTEPRVTFLSEIDVEGQYPAPEATVSKTRENVKGFGNDGSQATPIEVTLKCPDADRIELEHWGETVAKLESDVGVVSVETKELGGGPLRLRPVAYFGETKVLGRTLVDQVESER